MSGLRSQMGDMDFRNLSPVVLAQNVFREMKPIL